MKETFIHESIKTWIRFIEYWTSIFQENINDCVTVITSPIVSFASGAGGTTIEVVRSSIEGTCYTMLGVFALIEIIDTFTKKGEEMRWEEVARLLIKVLICKNLITIAPVILAILQSTVTTVLQDSSLGASLENLESVLNAELSATLNGYVSRIIYDAKGYKVFFKNIGLIIEVFFSGAGSMLLAMAMCALSLLIRTMSYLRGFELVVMASIVGIPLSFWAYSETRDIPKRYLLNYLAVCLQGLLIVICVFLYSNIIGNTTNKIEMLFWTYVLYQAVNKTGEWALKSIGQ